MNVNRGAGASIDRRNDIWLGVHRETDVADEALVQNGVDGQPVIACTFGKSTDFGARGRSVVIPGNKTWLPASGVPVCGTAVTYCEAPTPPHLLEHKSGPS